MEQIQSIIPTVPDEMQKRNMKNVVPVRQRRATVLNLLVLGDANNRVIPDLIDFTKTFFAKHTILNILAKYCIFYV